MGKEKVKEISKKGFNISYKAFENTPVFLQTMRKLYSCEEYPSIKSAYRIKRLCENIETELKNYMELRKKADNEEKLKELHEISFKIKWDKLSGEELKCIPKLSPADILTLEYVGDVSSFDH